MAVQNRRIEESRYRVRNDDQPEGFEFRGTKEVHFSRLVRVRMPLKIRMLWKKLTDLYSQYLGNIASSRYTFT